MLTGGFAKQLQCFGIVLWHPLLFAERSLSCAVVANQHASKLKVGTIVKSMVQAGRPQPSRFSHRFGHDHPGLRVTPVNAEPNRLLQSRPSLALTFINDQASHPQTGCLNQHVWSRYVPDAAPGRRSVAVKHHSGRSLESANKTIANVDFVF
jgi:hypothetical protein